MDKEQPLSDRTALITGAGGGMGRAIAVRLAESGATVIVNDRSENLLAQTVTELKALESDYMVIEADVTSALEIYEMVWESTARYGAIDILVNNAGVLLPTRFLDIEEDEWELVLDVNVKGTFLCTRSVIGDMIERGWGRVINMSSTAGKSVSTMGGAHYTTAKTAILGLTRAVAAETASYGVTVNAICPGLFDTDMTRRTISDHQVSAYAESFPIKRLGRPEEVADLVDFLASDKASYITGAAIDINGGDLMI